MLKDKAEREKKNKKAIHLEEKKTLKDRF